MIGSISSGTMRPQDLIPRFADVLEELAKAMPERESLTAKHYAELAHEARTHLESEEADEVLTALYEALEDFAPPYCYFGAHPGDGADYGFWLDEDWRVIAREEGVPIVEDTSEIPSNYEGYAFHVSDHGNLTLYDKQGDTLVEVWAIV